MKTSAKKPPTKKKPVKKSPATSIIFRADTRKQLDTICNMNDLSLSECLHRLVDYYLTSQHLLNESIKFIRAPILDAYDRGEDLKEWLADPDHLEDDRLRQACFYGVALGDMLIHGISTHDAIEDEFLNAMAKGFSALPHDRMVKILMKAEQEE